MRFYDKYDKEKGGEMRYKVRVFMGDTIEDISLSGDKSFVTIGSSSGDTLVAAYPDVAPSQLMFEYAEGNWLCRNRATGECRNITDGDVFVLSMSHRVAAAVYSDDVIPQRVVMKRGMRTSIGRGFDSMFHLPDRSVSNNHALIVSDDMGFVIKDCASLNGTYLNNRKITEHALTDGDIISIGKYNILFKNSTIELVTSDMGNHNSPSGVQYPVFSLSPRLRHRTPSDIIEIQAPPNIGNMPVVNWLSFLPMLATRSAYSAIFPLTSVFSTFLQKRKYKQAEEVRQEKYENYLADVKAKIDKHREDQFLSLEESNHETSQCFDIAVKRQRTLWERSVEDDDFMKLRIGKGDIEISFKIKFPDNVLKMYSDELEDQGEDLGRGNQIIEGAPILCDLYHDLSVGIIGDRQKAIATARNMIVQLASTHSYKDVKLVTLFSKREAKDWEFVKWLPHSFNDTREFRYVSNDVFNAAALEKTLDAELKDRKRTDDADQSDSRKKDSLPFYLFVVSEPELIEATEIENYLDNNYEGAGMGVIYVYDRIDDLPKSCNLIAEIGYGKNELYHKSNVGEKQRFEIDAFTANKAEMFARSLAPVRLAEKKTTADMPTCVTFLEGYGVKRVEDLPVWENWNNTNPAKSITVPLGVKSNGEPFMFNIMYGPDFMRYHGSHGLVAGATRSGKSEMVQSWILSLATRFSPEEVSFIIIDYKGTGMLLPFENLPHLAGKISNIDGMVRRNIIAINQEIRRRQLLFDRLGIKPEIKEYFAKGYHKTVEPMPAIIVIVDEFAEVKKNLPEFIPVLESLFAVGSALGIWVVLATQKPSGVVTDKMYANANFRWCCRVASSTDSKEMLHHTDAAKIKNAGRAYVQVGEDDIYEQVQSYWSGAPYLPDSDEKQSHSAPISMVDITGKRVRYESYHKETPEAAIKEIDAVVDYIRRTADIHGVASAPKIWQDKLPSRIYAEDIINDKSTEGISVPVGMIDNPYQQAQYPLNVDLASEGHCLVYGAPGTGKTTFLQTFIMSAAMNYTPRDINIYAMDFGSWSLNLFGGLPHVGGVANDNEPEKIHKLINMLTQELDHRKRTFAMNGIINIKSYEQMTGNKLASIVLVVDNLNSVFALYPEVDEFFIRLTREGASYGIYLLSSTGSGGVSFKITNNIKNSIALRMKDKSDYVSIVGKTDGLEPDNHMGRGLVKGMPYALEFQTALPARGEDDAEVLKAVREMVEALSDKSDVRARPIPVMPDVIGYGSVASKGIALGLSCDTIEPVEYCTDTSSHCMAISESRKCEGSGIFKVILKQFKDKSNARLVLYDCASLSSISHMADKYMTQASELDEYMEYLASELTRRKNLPTLDDEDIIVLALDGYRQMYDAIDDKTASRLSAFVRMGAGLKVYLVVSDTAESMASLSSVEPVLKNIISEGTGILVGDSFKAHGAFDTGLMSYTEVSKPLGEYEAYIIQKGKVIKFKAMCEF